MSVVVGPASARAFEVERGSAVRIVDPDGCQVGDVFCVARDDPSERFSQARTRVYLQRLTLRPGDGLWSTRDRPLLTLEEDTVGTHDLLFCGCSAYVFSMFLGAPGKTGCLDHLSAALDPWGVTRDAVEAPLDLFMATEVTPAGDLVVHPSPSRPGDYVVLRAQADVVVALAACADDVTACNGGRCGPLAVDVIPSPKGAP
jgi:uncharacterized protein YcgI (DUF1989 family)